MSALGLPTAPPELASPPAVAGAHLWTGQLAALERGWKRLYRQARPANPFLSWEWQSAWVAAHPDGVRPLVVAEPFPDGTLAGVLALQRTRRRGLVQLEFLGQGSGGDDLDCLLHPGAAPKTAERLFAAALARQRWELLRLESVRADSACAAALAGRTGLCLEPGEWLPSLALPTSFEQFLAGRSANFRAEIRRRRRAFARRAPHAWVECAATPSAVTAGLEHLYRLHNLRRAQKRDRGIFESAPLRAFHRRVAPQLAAQGWARIYLLRTPSQVVAALYGFEADDRFLYFQSGFDPAFTEASPGTVLLSAVVEDAIVRGLRQFEFLRGEEAYKNRWTAERRRSQNLWLPRGITGRAWLELRSWRRRLRKTPA